MSSYERERRSRQALGSERLNLTECKRARRQGRRVVCRRKKGQSNNCGGSGLPRHGAAAAHERRLPSARPVIESWHWTGAVAPGTARVIFDPATYRSADRPRQKLAVLIAWMCRTICKCAQNEPFVFRRKLASRLCAPPLQLNRESFHLELEKRLV